MDWVSIIEKTGSVGVIGYLIYYLAMELFSEKIINLFGSDRLFAIVLIILSVLGLALFMAISNSRNKELEASKDSSVKNINVVYKDKSTHKGNNIF